MTPLLLELSPREELVLLLAAEGLTVVQTAHRLGIAWQTVRDHRANACRKLDAANTTQAVAILVRRRDGVPA